jgi:hypothetical protein
MRKHTITVNDKMQKGYRYVRSEPIGRNFDPGHLTCRARQRQALLHWAYDSRKI